MKRLLLTAAAGIIAMPAFTASAQQAEPQEEYVYPQKAHPEGVDNYLFSIYYNSGKKAFNTRGLKTAKASNPIARMKVNPSGTSFAVLEKDKKGKSTVTVNDLWKSNKKIHTFKGVADATDIDYTPDARHLAIATPGKVTFYDARLFTPAFEIMTETDTPTTMIVFSPDARTMATVNDKDVNIFSTETRELRKTLDFDSDITDMDFSNGNDIFAVLTSDGSLSAYDANRYLIMQTIDGLGLANALSFNPDDKFYSVVTGDSRVAVVNRYDDEDRDFIDNEIGGITDARFVKDMKGNVYLAYTTGKNITYKLMDALPPNFTKLLADELNDRMNEWMKMMPGESLEDYNLRVNDDTRMAQMKLFEQEIATRMADNLVSMSTVTLGDYSPESGLLAVNFDNMPPIYLNVPTGDLNSFMDGGDLEFRNAKYGLTPNDKFELIYADVYNKKTGNTYTFNNLERQSLAYLTESENFVPLGLIQQSNLDELRLQDIQDDIISLAKQQNKVSDHTHFTVDAKVVPDTDPMGQKITNYQVNFTYEVDPGYSAQEDFAPGKYKANESPAAYSMLEIIKTAMESDFAKYIKPGKKMLVEITGMADAMPIRNRMAYDGTYGNFIDEPVYKNGDLTALTVTKATGITDNDQLAFLRGSGVRDFIETQIKGLDGMQKDYRNNIEVTEGTGGQFRRIKVELTFVDAF